MKDKISKQNMSQSQTDHPNPGVNREREIRLRVVLLELVLNHPAFNLSNTSFSEGEKDNNGSILRRVSQLRVIAKVRMTDSVIQIPQGQA